MADLAKTDVTIGMGASDRYYPPAAPVMAFPTIKFGDAVKDYPAGGIPLPDIGAFGFHKEVTRFIIQQPKNGYEYRYDPATHKLLIMMGNYDAVADGPLIEFSGAPAETTLPLILYGE
jgi:hypothetical protein